MGRNIEMELSIVFTMGILNHPPRSETRSPVSLLANEGPIVRGRSHDKQMGGNCGRGVLGFTRIDAGRRRGARRVEPKSR
jgi:hypothetical protein